MVSLHLLNQYRRAHAASMAFTSAHMWMNTTFVTGSFRASWRACSQHPLRYWSKGSSRSSSSLVFMFHLSHEFDDGLGGAGVRHTNTEANEAITDYLNVELIGAYKTFTGVYVVLWRVPHDHIATRVLGYSHRLFSLSITPSSTNTKGVSGATGMLKR